MSPARPSLDPGGGAAAAPSATAYVCPRTRRPLEPRGDALASADGQVSYPLRRGVPCFLSRSPEEDPATVARLRRLLRVARDRGWREALADFQEGDQARLSYVTDPRRTAFVELLPLEPGVSRVLELGPSLGQITEALARRSGSVDALEVVPEQAEFVHLRARQQGLEQVRVACGGDDCLLPYPAGAFDCAVLNLVFEWCASRAGGDAMEATQRRLLAETARVLRPGGTLYLATKNRYSLGYLAGGADEHAYGLPFGNALPRFALRKLLGRRGHDAPRGLLHGHRALAAMLRQAGFAAPRSLWALPDFRFPERFVPTDAEAIRAARRAGLPGGARRHQAALARWVPAPLVRHLTPGLVFLAERAPAPPSS